jgi:lipid-A-disaccharide synthase
MRKIMFIAGEASGDANAAPVITALSKQAQIFGAGGPKMKAAGMETLVDLTEHAVVGLVEVLKNYSKFKHIFDALVREAERRGPDAIVLVDFPGFNLRFARQMKRRGFKVIYYISPQLWAWHAGRAKQIERDVDLMLTIFPFEKSWYARHARRLRVEFVGHPLADRSQNPEPSLRDATVQFRSQSRIQNLVLLLPGSREREVAKIWPVMARVVEQLPSTYEFVAAAVDDRTAAMIHHPRVRVETGTARDWMQRAGIALTASGTATIECAFAGCPMIVLYKVNWLTYLAGRLVVKVNWLAMPNVIAGRDIVPEFIQHEAQPKRIAAVVRELLDNPAKRETMRAELKDVVRTLGGPGANKRAAHLILQEIGGV